MSKSFEGVSTRTYKRTDWSIGKATKNKMVKGMILDLELLESKHAKVAPYMHDFLALLPSH